MSSPAVPVLLQRGTALFLFALGIFLVAVHATMAAAAARQSGPDTRLRLGAPLGVAAFLAAWLGLALLVGDAAHFPLSGGEPRQLVSLLVGFGPVLVAVALLVGSRSVRALYEAMPPEWLIRVQTYRVGGLLFLFPFLYYGLVPAGFAVPAAIGDFLTGLFAPVVAAAVARRRPGALGWAVAWNLFGILDLLVAPAAAVRSHAPVLTMYPLVLVPLFIGPPLGILTHVFSLRNLAAGSRTVPDATPATAGAG